MWPGKWLMMASVHLKHSNLTYLATHQTTQPSQHIVDCSGCHNTMPLCWG